MILETNMNIGRIEQRQKKISERMSTLCVERSKIMGRLKLVSKLTDLDKEIKEYSKLYSRLVAFYVANINETVSIEQIESVIGKLDGYLTEEQIKSCKTIIRCDFDTIIDTIYPIIRDIINTRLKEKKEERSELKLELDEANSKEPLRLEDITRIEEEIDKLSTEYYELGLLLELIEASGQYKKAIQQKKQVN